MCSLYSILSHHKFTVRCPGRRNNFVFPAMLPAPAFSKHSLQFSGYRSSLHLSIYPPPPLSTSICATTAAPAFSSFGAETWGILEKKHQARHGKLYWICINGKKESSIHLVCKSIVFLYGSNGNTFHRLRPTECPNIEQWILFWVNSVSISLCTVYCVLCTWVVGGGKVATNFSVSSRQGFRLWGLSP